MFFPNWGMNSGKKKGKHKPSLHGKNPHAVALAKLGSSKGGRERAKKLTPFQRSEIARKAALARWKK